MGIKLKTTKPLVFKGSVPKKLAKKQAVDPNAKRRAVYASDESHRKVIQDKARTRYRVAQNNEFVSCKRALEYFESLAVDTEVVFYPGAIALGEMPVLSVPVAAECLGKKYQTVWHWIRKGTIPAPVLKSVPKNRLSYHVEEVRVFLEEIGNVTQSFAYLRKDTHASVVHSIAQRIADVRRKLKITE